MFNSANTVKPGSHYFTVPTGVKEISIESIMKELYENDLVEPESQYYVNNKINLIYHNLYNNYKIFLELIEKKAARTDGHYQLPLPHKDKEVVLPNTRMTEMQRLKELNNFTIITNASWMN